jgi:uncharacterized protein (DUF924 family)
MEDPEISQVLAFWFGADRNDRPTIDARMDRWFGSDPGFDAEVGRRFGELVERASKGRLADWPTTARGRLALILLLDQFRRHMYRGRPEAFRRDAQALKLCVEGAMTGDYKTLDPFEQAFFFMPLQHAESLKVQERSVKIYAGLVAGVSDTLKATFATFAQFAELHRDIVATYGRFPHRNRILGRADTPSEREFLAVGPTFGQ